MGFASNEQCTMTARAPPLPFPKGEGPGVGFPSARRCILNLPSPFSKGRGRGWGFPLPGEHPPPSFALIGAKVPLRGTCCLACCDQAACIFDALAWSFEQNRVFDPLCIFDAQLHTRNRRRVILNEGGRLPSPRGGAGGGVSLCLACIFQLPSPFLKGRGRGWGLQRASFATFL